MKPRMCRLVCVLIASVLVAVGGVALAQTTCKYYPMLTNCEGDGGWVIHEDNGDGSFTIHILCDGGNG